MFFLKKNEKGRTMVEMMGVISIISLLTITSIGGYKFLTGKIRISNMEDALLKTVLVVEGGQVKTIEALDRFLGHSMKGLNAQAAPLATCALSDRRYSHCYKITFTNLDRTIVSYFKENEVKEYKVGNTSGGTTLVIEFASSKRLN